MEHHLDSAVRDDRRADASAASAATTDGFAAERIDDLFSVLASARRRHVIDYLHESGPAADLDELAAELASRDGPMDETDGDAHKRAYLSLYHGDVPKMVDAGFVTVDEATGEVALIDGPGPVRRYLGLASAEPADD